MMIRDSGSHSLILGEKSRFSVPGVSRVRWIGRTGSRKGGGMQEQDLTLLSSSHFISIFSLQSLPPHRPFRCTR